MPETHTNDIVEVKKAIETLSQGFEEGRSAIESKSAEEIKKASGVLEEKLTKIAEDLSTKHEALEEKQKKLDAAMNRVRFQDADQSKKKLLWKEGKKIQEWMRSAAGSKDAHANIADIVGADLLAESKGLSVSDDTQAGFSVKPQIETMLDATITEMSIFRQMARTVNLTNSDSMERLINQKGGVGATRDDETEFSANSDTGNPTLSLDNIPVNYLSASIPVTQQLLDDAGFDMAAWIDSEARESFDTRMDTEYFIGRDDGTISGTVRSKKEARGILTYGSGTAYGQIEQIDSGANGAFDADTILELFGSMKADHLGGAACFANRQTIWKDMFSLKDDNGAYILARDFSNGPTFRVLGAPIYAAPAMPVAATGSLSLALINVARCYTVVNRSGSVLLRDPYTIYPQVAFRYRLRTGGDVEVFEACKLYKLSV